MNYMFSKISNYHCFKEIVITSTYTSYIEFGLSSEF